MCSDTSRPSPAGPADPRVFISAKSGDYDHAAKVYDFLTAAGVCTFFSRESLPELGSSDYRREIDHALDVAQHLVVVASSLENVQASWVEAEWGFFINEKRSGRKNGNLVTVLVGGLKPGDLPPSLRYYEAIPFEPAAFDKLLRYVQEARAERPAAREAAAPSGGRLAFREAATFGGPPPVKLLAATSDGRAIATGGLDGAVRPYDVATRTRCGFLASGRYRKARHEGLITALDFSPGGDLIASGHLDGSVHVWEVGRDEELSENMRHDWAISGLAFSADTRTLATASKDGTVKVWDVSAVKGGQARHGLHRKPAPVVSMAALSARGWLVIGLVNAATRRYALQVHEMTEACPVLATLSLADSFALLAASVDGRLLAAGGADGTVRVYDLDPVADMLARQEQPKTVAPLATLTGQPKAISSMAFFPDGRNLVALATDNKMTVWDLQTWKAAFRIHASSGEQFASAAVLDRGRTLAATLADGRVRLWEAT